MSKGELTLPVKSCLQDRYISHCILIEPFSVIYDVGASRNIDEDCSPRTQANYKIEM